MTQIIPRRCYCLCLKVDDNGELSRYHRYCIDETANIASQYFCDFFATFVNGHTF
jgi:hypothetical protein